MCDEIVDSLDLDKNNVMSWNEIQNLVKNLHPRYSQVPTSAVEVTDPEVLRLNGMSKSDLAQYLATEVDYSWVLAYHMFLGLSGDSRAALGKMFEPGVYEVVWMGGVRYRNSNSYSDVYEGSPTESAAEMPIASVGQTYRIRFFVKGDTGDDTEATEVWYGYLEWARLFIPMTFRDGSPALQHRAPFNDDTQLKKMAQKIFEGLGVPADAGVAAADVMAYLDSAHIGHDKERLRGNLLASDLNGDGKVQLKEFIDCFIKYQSISDCLWLPTKELSDRPHPSCVAHLVHDSPAKPARPGWFSGNIAAGEGGVLVNHNPYEQV